MVAALSSIVSTFSSNLLCAAAPADISAGLVSIHQSRARTGRARRTRLLQYDSGATSTAWAGTNRPRIDTLFNTRVSPTVEEVSSRKAWRPRRRPPATAAALSIPLRHARTGRATPSSHGVLPNLSLRPSEGAQAKLVCALAVLYQRIFFERGEIPGVGRGLTFKHCLLLIRNYCEQIVHTNFP